MNKEKRWDQLGEVRVRIIKAKSFLLTNYDPKGTLTYFRAFFKSFGEKAEVFGRYKSIGDTDLSATFSRHGLMESIKKSADMTVFPHVLMNIGSLLNSAIEIKRFLQERDNEHIKAWHILISVLEFGGDLFLVEILVKEMKNPEENSVYLITNKEKVDSVSRTGTDPNAPTESTCTITIDDLAKKVNGSTMRYFPDHFFYGDRLNAKRKYEEEALIHFESKLKKKNWNSKRRCLTPRFGKRPVLGLVVESRYGGNYRILSPF